MSFLTKVSNTFSGLKKIGGLMSPTFFSQFFFPSRRNRKSVSNLELQKKYKASSLAYSCIKKIADVSNDARLYVEKLNSKNEWEEIPHPLTNLLKRPNGYETGRQLRRKIIQSENACGIVYIHLARRRPSAVPFQIAILNPIGVTPETDANSGMVTNYRYQDPVGRIHIIDPNDILIKRLSDFTNEFEGLAPLEVALNAVDSEINQADFVNSFFEGGGYPAGVLTFEDYMSDEQLEYRQKSWMNKYGREGSLKGQVAVMDKKAKFETFGAKLNELSSEENTFINEAKICGVFGVSPILVYTYLGIRFVNQRASYKDALTDFGITKIKPDLTEFCEWLTFCFLSEFEDERAILTERIRVNYDASDVAALQEDQDKIHDRARKNAAARIWTVDEARQATGKEPLPNGAGQVLLQPQNIRLITDGNQLVDIGGNLPGDIAENSDAEDEEIIEGEDGEKYQITSCPKCSGVKSDCELCKGNGKVKLSVMPIQKKKLNTKLYEYEGIILARKPKGVETIINLKGMVDDMEETSETVRSQLSRLRKSLILQAVRKSENLDETSIAELKLTINKVPARQILEKLATAYETGRKQVIDDINRQRAAKSLIKINTKDFESDESKKRIESLSKSAISKMLQEITSRAMSVYLALKITNFNLEDFFDEMLDRLLSESKAFLDLLSRDVTNAAIQTGRKDEIDLRQSDGNEIEYSAILDKNACKPCKDEDGKRSTNKEDLQPVPNPECKGGSRCRCFHVLIVV